MVYRLYVETVKKDERIGWSFMVFNHQDFNVYKLCGVENGKCEEDVILEISARALTYFSNFIRRRYYDEHFATILDEDYITLFTKYEKIAECYANGQYKVGFNGENKALWEKLIPFFERPTMSFETASDKKFTDMARALAEKAII